MEKINKITAKSYLWNTIGSILSAASSLFLLMCVTRVVGAAEGGIFSLAFATAQLVLTIGKFGVRSYQATDIFHELSLSTYFVSRGITCILMLMLGAGTVVLAGYSLYKGTVVLAVCVIKMVDAVEDVYHGQLQLVNRLYIAGKLLAARNIFTMVIFAVTITMSKKLLFTCWITGISSLALCIMLNHVYVNKYEKIKFCWNRTEQKALFFACFPLFSGSFLSLLIYNIPKYAIDIYCSTEIQTYYAIIFMPAFMINMFSEFAFKPMLTSLAEWWKNGERQRFIAATVKLIANIFLVTIVILGIMYLIGADILSFVYGVDVTSYKMELMLLLLGGGFSAAVYFLYNVLSAMRRQKAIFRNYSIGTVFIFFLAFYSVKTGGMSAAALSYVLAEIVLCSLMLWSTFHTHKKDFKK